MPYLTTALPGTGGAAKTVPEDFVVEEIPAYPPAGEGSHAFLTVEKRGITTQDLVARLARALGIAPGDIGVAGQKDRQAIARQVVSVPLPPGDDPARLLALPLEGAKVLSAARHPHKLRTGHLHGNRFTLTLRGVVADAEARAGAILALLSREGLPNFFGEQRFGRAGDNAASGRAMLLGERREKDRFRRKLLASAFQASLFNRYLAARMEEGLLRRTLPGDVLQKTRTGGLFVCGAAPEEVASGQARLEAGEVVPTGPIFGHKMFAPGPGSEAAAREERLLAEEGIVPATFAALGRLAEGTRRPLFVPVEGASARKEEDRLIVTFSLPSGSYATVLLDELIKGDAEPSA